MEAAVEKITIHEGVELFRESQFSHRQELEGGTKIFLLYGLREREVLAAV